MTSVSPQSPSWTAFGGARHSAEGGITAAGGSGNGAARALYNLEDYLKRVGFEIFDLVPVTKFSKDHKLPMLEAAGRRLAEQ